MNAISKTKWHISGEEAGACNCNWGCPCQFNAEPTHGRCEALAGWQIAEGSFGEVSLKGVRFAALYWWPGPIHNADGTRQLIIDEQTTQEQRDALNEMHSGSHGGTYFEIFSAVAPNALDTIVAPISFESDREKRLAHVKIPDVGEFMAEPIKNPVTGEEHRARIVLPNGFEYKEAEVANAISLRATSKAPLVFENKGTYAQLNSFDWSN